MNGVVINRRGGGRCSGGSSGRRKRRRDGGDPAQGLGEALLAGVLGGVVGDDAAEDEAGDEAAAVGPVVDTRHEESEDENGDDPRDEARGGVAACGPVATGGDGDHKTDQAEDGSAGAEREMVTEIGAEEKSGGACYGVEKKVACGTVEFFDDGADVHQHHHVEADVDEAAVEIGGGDEAIPLVHDENGKGENWRRGDKWIHHPCPREW